MFQFLFFFPILFCLFVDANKRRLRLRNEKPSNQKFNTPKKGPSFPPSSPPTSRPKPDTDSIWSMPTMTTTTTRRTTTTTTTRRPLFTTKAPFYNPADPSYNGAGGYFGNRYDDRTTPRYTTKRPSSSGGGFFSGFSDILQGELGKFINSALSNRGGSGSSGFGGFDTRPVMENKNRGNFGLFNENTRGTSLSSNNDYHKYPVTRYGSESSMSASPYATTTHAPSHGNFGWKVSK